MIQCFSVSVSCDSSVLSLLVFSVLCLSVCQYLYVSNVCSVSVTVLGIQCFLWIFLFPFVKGPVFPVFHWLLFPCCTVSMFQFSSVVNFQFSVFPVILILTPHRSLSLRSCVTGLGFAFSKSQNKSLLLSALTLQWGESLCKGAQVVLLWNLGSGVWKRNSLITLFSCFIMRSHPGLGYFLQKANLLCWSRCLTDIKIGKTLDLPLILQYREY